MYQQASPAGSPKAIQKFYTPPQSPVSSYVEIESENAIADQKDTWKCKHCTYINSYQNNICEICLKTSWVNFKPAPTQQPQQQLQQQALPPRQALPLQQELPPQQAPPQHKQQEVNKVILDEKPVNPPKPIQRQSSTGSQVKNVVKDVS